MSIEEHRFYFSTKFSSQNLGEFNVNLPFPVDLQGKWKCSIRDAIIKLDNIETDCIYILADFCVTSSIQQNKQLPILKKVYLKSKQNWYDFPQPLYIPVKQVNLTDFSLLFLDSDLNNISFRDNFLIECTIHFYKHG